MKDFRGGEEGESTKCVEIGGCTVRWECHKRRRMRSMRVVLELMAREKAESGGWKSSVGLFAICGDVRGEKCSRGGCKWEVRVVKKVVEEGCWDMRGYRRNGRASVLL